MLTREPIRAEPDQVEQLLDLMADFNAVEGTRWDRDVCRPALEQLLRADELGVASWFRDGDSIVGYFVLTWGFDLEWSGRDAFLTEIFLVETARGKGLGSAAMRLVEGTASEHGARALHLMVRPENTPALRMYLSAGFTEPPRKLLSKPLR